MHMCIHIYIYVCVYIYTYTRAMSCELATRPEHQRCTYGELVKCKSVQTTYRFENSKLRTWFGNTKFNFPNSVWFNNFLFEFRISDTLEFICAMTRYICGAHIVRDSETSVSGLFNFSSFITFKVQTFKSLSLNISKSESFGQNPTYILLKDADASSRQVKSTKRKVNPVKSTKRKVNPVK